MKNTPLFTRLGALLVLIIVLLGGFFWFQNRNDLQTQETTTEQLPMTPAAEVPVQPSQTPEVPLPVQNSKEMTLLLPSESEEDEFVFSIEGMQITLRAEGWYSYSRLWQGNFYKTTYFSRYALERIYYAAKAIAQKGPVCTEMEITFVLSTQSEVIGCTAKIGWEGLNSYLYGHTSVLFANAFDLGTEGASALHYIMHGTPEQPIPHVDKDLYAAGLDAWRNGDGDMMPRIFPLDFGTLRDP